MKSRIARRLFSLCAFMKLSNISSTKVPLEHGSEVDLGLFDGKLGISKRLNMSCPCLSFTSVNHKLYCKKSNPCMLQSVKTFPSLLENVDLSLSYALDSKVFIQLNSIPTAWLLILEFALITSDSILPSSVVWNSANMFPAPPTLRFQSFFLQQRHDGTQWLPFYIIQVFLSNL